MLQVAFLDGNKIDGLKKDRGMIKESPAFLKENKDNTSDGLWKEEETKDASTCRRTMKESQEKRNEDISRE